MYRVIILRLIQQIIEIVLLECYCYILGHVKHQLDMV